MKLSDEQVRQYREQGYVAVEGVVPMDHVQEMRRATDEFVEQSREASTHTEVFDLEPGHSAAEPKLRRLKNPIHQHEAYRKVLDNAVLLDLVAQLIGPAIRLHNTKLNMKNPEHGSGVEWHQDYAFYPHTNDSVLAVGIALDDISVENGAMLVIPGSHKGPVLSHHQDGTFIGAVTEPGFEVEGAVPVTMKAGGISIHHGHALHASAPNHTNHPRRLLLVEMTAVDAWPVMGVPDWDAFNAKIVRGEPTFQPRMETGRFRVSVPRVAGGSIYELQEKAQAKVMTAPPPAR